MVTFSRRLPADLRPNRLSRAREEHGPPEYDLTVTNPTLCDLQYPGDLLGCLDDPAATVYQPDPRGPEAARSAIAAEYERWGGHVDPERIVLTASTSEAYGLLLRLLADPGDSILVPSPSYPLFEMLGRLDSAELTVYPLDPDAGWRMAAGAVVRAPDRCRMAVAVHPNNPTGSLVHPDDGAALVALCRDHEMALVVDEVFLPFVFDASSPPVTSFASTAGCLCFALGGLSKWVGLPQVKLAWIVVSGPDDAASEALDRLCHIADAYLTVSSPVALAAPRLLEAGRPVRRAIRDRCAANLAVLTTLADSKPSVTVTVPEGGWSAALRYPAVVDEEVLCLQLLEQLDVDVQPGFFFDFPGSGWLVVSLLPPPHLFEEGVRRILRFIATSAHR
jgi:aspartate/methionine/tyrosine aminotransferase